MLFKRTSQRVILENLGEDWSGARKTYIAFEGGEYHEFRG